MEPKQTDWNPNITWNNQKFLWILKSPEKELRFVTQLLKLENQFHSWMKQYMFLNFYESICFFLVFEFLTSTLNLELERKIFWKLNLLWKSEFLAEQISPFLKAFHALL